ncbi:MAG: IS110 family transposase, partial [Desulfobacula sp.]|nr:IS110 family transposase [Desulfobacula sp.]
MKFYTKQHKYYCGIDLHARSMYLCILDSKNRVKLHKDIKTSPDALMKAIHGGKAKNDKVDSHKIANLAKGGTFPMAFVYPRDMKSTRDLMRPRMHLIRKRAELLSHIHNTNTQYNYDPLGKNLRYKANRKLVDKRFSDPSVQKS